MFKKCGFYFMSIHFVLIFAENFPVNKICTPSKLHLKLHDSRKHLHYSYSPETSGVRVYTVFSFFVFKFANENRITNSFFVFKLANEKRIPFSFFVFISEVRKTKNVFVFAFRKLRPHCHFEVAGKSWYYRRDTSVALAAFWKQTRRNCVREVIYLST